jgi:hypothetical protein
VGEIALTSLGYAIGPIIISRKLNDVPPLGVVAGSLLIAVLLYAPAELTERTCGSTVVIPCRLPPP